MGDWREVLHRVEGQFLEQRWIDRDRSVEGDQQGVAIRRGLGNEVRSDIAARAGLGLDHDRLPERLRQFGRHQPSGEVHGPPDDRHDDAHRF